METERTTYSQSAFRHGFSRRDYEQVWRNRKIVVRSRRGIESVYEVFGRNDAGAYIHAIIRRTRPGLRRETLVFHMNMMTSAERDRFRRMLGI